MKLFLAWSIFILLLVSFMLSNCSRPTRAVVRDSLLLSTENLDVYYDLNDPQAKYFLPYYLAEISGLTFKSPNSLLAVQDEEGILYEYDLIAEKVINKLKFDSKGDFEGVELTGDTVFVIESNGELRMFSIQNSLELKNKLKRLETGLTSKNNVEGLGYDPMSNSLLIACKASGEVNGNKISGKAVYKMKLKTFKVEKAPFFEVTKKDLEKYFEQHKHLDYDADRFRFDPSAIAFNPIDQLYYLMASVGKLIIVFNAQGEILATYSIPSSQLIQPEGLCFSPDGDMFISSEGDGDKGYIIKYSMKRK